MLPALYLIRQAPLSMRILQARILEWVAISFPRGSSQPMDWTWVSHIAGRFFTVWATGEALISVTKESRRNECWDHWWTLPSFPFVESNGWLLLHCRQMLYHLRHQGSNKDSEKEYQFLQEGLSFSETRIFIIPISLLKWIGGGFGIGKKERWIFPILVKIQAAI